MARIERATSPLPRECSTTEPHGRCTTPAIGRSTVCTGRLDLAADVPKPPQTAAVEFSPTALNRCLESRNPEAASHPGAAPDLALLTLLSLSGQDPPPDRATPQRLTTTHPPMAAGRVGAGEGNRTLVISLEGFCSTIELHPHRSIRLPYSAGSDSVLARPALLCRPALCRPGGGGWIRTNVGVSQQIYSLPPLATRAPLQGTANYDLGVCRCQTKGAAPES